MVSQLPLALPYPSDHCFETFVNAPDGLIAWLTAVALGHSRDWLYLVGPASTGKSHLAIALCTVAQRAGRQVAYIPLHKVSGHTAQIFDGLDHADLVVIDALEVLIRYRHDEVALFDFYNRARAQGATVMFCARQAPDQLALTLADLRSRLAHCCQVALASLDDQARAVVVRERAQRRGLVLEQPAIDWLFTHMGRDLASLLALLDHLDRAAMAAQRRLTLPFLRAQLKNNLAQEQ